MPIRFLRTNPPGGIMAPVPITDRKKLTGAVLAGIGSVCGWVGADVGDAATRADMGLNQGRIFMPTFDEHILRILGEAPEGLFASDIAERLNKALRPDSEYKGADVAKQLKGMTDQVAQLPDGRWMLKRLML